MDSRKTSTVELTTIAQLNAPGNNSQEGVTVDERYGYVDIYEGKPINGALRVELTAVAIATK